MNTQNAPLILRKLWSLSCILLLTLVMGGCAANAPKIQTDFDQDVNFASFQTFGFIHPLNTDEAGYSTLTSAYFKTAAMAEMEALGYLYTDESPDLLLNFFSDIESRFNTNTMVGMSSANSYYANWFFYSPIYGRMAETRTRHYKTDSLKIDIVNAAERKLVWQGSTENRIRKKDRDDPQATINSIVHLILQKFSARSSTTP